LVQAIGEAMGGDAQQRRAAFIAEVAKRQMRFLRSSAGAGKLVIFASDETFAVAIAAALHDLGIGSLFDAAKGQDVAEDFAGCDCAAVAVFGPAGEEGLNLHFADAILHADLPASVGRLEQRIGRLDRFGRTRGPIKHVFVGPAADDDTPWTAWCDLLRDGFGIFDRPVSDIQFVLSDIEIEVGRRMLLGPQALLAFREELIIVLAHHRERLDEQYAMDQLAMVRDSARALADAFDNAEADEDDLERRVGGFLESTLQLNIQRDGADVITLGWRPNTQLPERPWHARFSPGLGRPLTWKRRVSVARPQVGLLRPGSSLIDSLERLLEWDDRGAAFATWRMQPGAGGPGQESMAFRLCWVIGPGAPPPDLLQPGEDAEGLRRQAEGFLQPWTHTQHVGPDLLPIEERKWLEILQRPYQAVATADGGRDFNLGSRPEWVRQVIDRTTFAQLCAQVATGATATLQASEAYCGRVLDAQTQFHQEMERRASRRRMRAGFDNDAASARAAVLDKLVCDLIARPQLRLDCIGAFIVAGYVPQSVSR
jgi:ATP-dependent helicase HepA